MLLQRDAIGYLLERGLIGEDVIVDGDITVVDASSRNSNFKVMSSRRPCFLLKQGLTEEGAITVAHERCVYENLHSRSSEPSVGRYIPVLHDYDERRGVLVLELFPTACTAREYQMNRARLPIRFAAASGKALAALHSRPAGHPIPTSGNLVQSGPPWILSIGHPILEVFEQASSGTLQLIRVIQDADQFDDLLQRLLGDYGRERLIHGDLKWDNWLVLTMPPGKAPEVKLIDWELSSAGDPCWDVGTVFHEYVTAWIRSIPLMTGAPPDRSMELARMPLDAVQPACRAFWLAYVTGMDETFDNGDEWLLPAVRYAAARLIQTAFEELQGAPELTANAVCMLQVSLNMLQRPEVAAVHLLGVPLVTE